MKSSSNFERLVLGCMDSYDSNKILIFSHFSRSTRFAILCTAQIAKFQKKRVTILAVLNNYSKLFIQNFAFFKSKVRFFVKMFNEILSEYHEHAPNVKRFQFLEKKHQFFRKILENSGNVQIIQKIIQFYSVVSLP